MKKLMVFLVILCMAFGFAAAEEEIYETTTVYVTANQLNGRVSPRKTSPVEVTFDKYFDTTCYGWSENHNWVEVQGGETGTVWVSYKYVTERLDDFTVCNDYGQKIKIREKPYGKVIGYLKPGKELIIEQVLLGWGRSSRGWIDLYYVTEED